ncbi:MAG: hypothetical protein NDJ89_15175, partial [Oligoflexia bacterium]|nr:hypothetical protein [Oligoflexia bacterium]
LTGTIARTITGARKGVRKGRFWDALAYSRVVTWGRELKNVSIYVIMNELEGQGIWSRHWAGSSRKEIRLSAGAPPRPGPDIPTSKNRKEA